MLNDKGIRELAYVVKVTDVFEMDADRLERVQINGWNCVCGKGEFHKGDLGVFFEIDSKLPDVKPFSDMEFLVKKHFKIKSQKIRGVISQGLLIPLSAFDFGDKVKEGDFLTEKLGVTYSVVADEKRKKGDPNAKYKAMSARHKNLAHRRWWRWLMKRSWGRKLLFFFFGKKRDNPLRFPKHFEFIKPTDEERVENMPWILEDPGYWIKTEKIDGTSSTYILERKGRNKFEYYVCSRNVRQMDRDSKNFHSNMGVEDNVYWAMSDKYKIYDFLKDYLVKNKDLKYIGLQGETAGPKLQGNPLKLPDIQFFGFNFIRSDVGRLNSLEARDICAEYNIPWVPIVEDKYLLPKDLEEFKLSADGPSVVSPVGAAREGFVYRDLEGKRSFKNVSREFLLNKKG